ncbi:hypothetical protein LMG28727_07376 [Paraburkholderia kirstenboschensis]|nr:hypothetical protein LMG28727_07376 [Paraburkholderia kirstenboschensis]
MSSPDDKTVIVQRSSAPDGNGQHALPAGTRIAAARCCSISARRVIGDMTQALTVILKPGYAPVEQCAEVASRKQCPWTDVYALAAVVYFAVQGKTPPTSVGRLMSDTYAPLAVTAAGRYTDRFLRAIDHALAVRPENRPPDVQAFAKELGISIDMPAPAELTSGGDTSGARGAYGSSAAPKSATRSRADGESMRRHQDGGAKRLPPATAVDDRRSRGAGLIIGAAVCIVPLAGGGTWMATRSPPPPATAVPRAAPVAAGAATTLQPGGHGGVDREHPDAIHFTASRNAHALHTLRRTRTHRRTGRPVDSSAWHAAQHDRPHRQGPFAIQAQQHPGRLRLCVHGRPGQPVPDAVSKRSGSQQYDRGRADTLTAARELADAGGRTAGSQPFSGARVAAAT